MKVTEKLVEIGLGTPNNAIPESAYTAAQKLLLDTIGCAVVGASAPGVREVTELMLDWEGKQEAELLFSSKKIPAPSAVFANSTAIHALDYDDVYIPGALHLTSIVIPIMLAAAEMSGASGKEMLAGMISGIEVAGRLSFATRYHRRGSTFLPTSLEGSFGGVITGAKILNMSSKETINAMGINYAQVSGNRQALLDFTLTKRMQPAFAARSVMWALALAKKGITGAKNVFEGDAGFFKGYMDGSADLELIDSEYPSFQVERVSIKRYPSCGASHIAQIAAEKLIKKKLFKPDEIEKVELFNCGPGGLVGYPFKIGNDAQVSAQFSVRWAVAHTLLRGPATLEDYTEENVRKDTKVAEFANKIEFVSAPPEFADKTEIPYDFREYYSFYVGLIVYTKDGKRFPIGQSRGSAFDPKLDNYQTTSEKFRETLKFASNSSPELAEEIIQTVACLDKTDSIAELLGLLRKVSIKQV